MKKIALKKETTLRLDKNYLEFFRTIAVAQLPWGHISLLIQSIKSGSLRKWYADHY